MTKEQAEKLKKLFEQDCVVDIDSIYISDIVTEIFLHEDGNYYYSDDVIVEKDLADVGVEDGSVSSPMGNWWITNLPG